MLIFLPLVLLPLAAVHLCMRGALSIVFPCTFHLKSDTSRFCRWLEISLFLHRVSWLRLRARCLCVESLEATNGCGIHSYGTAQMDQPGHKRSLNMLCDWGYNLARQWALWAMSHQRDCKCLIAQRFTIGEPEHFGRAFRARWNGQQTKTHSQCNVCESSMYADRLLANTANEQTNTFTIAKQSPMAIRWRLLNLLQVAYNYAFSNSPMDTKITHKIVCPPLHSMS